MEIGPGRRCDILFVSEMRLTSFTFLASHIPINVRFGLQVPPVPTPKDSCTFSNGPAFALG